MDDVEVKTVFTVDDHQQHERMKAMKEQADEAATALEHARASGKSVGNILPSAGDEGLSHEEREAYEEARAERKLRKQRMLIEKTELQKEQVLHRGVESAMMAVMGEQNKLAEEMGKRAAMMEGLGVSLSGFGGKIGGIGKILTGLGSAGAIASLALSGAGWVLDKFGIDIEEVAGDIKTWGMHLAGMKTGDEIARAAGFVSAADQKAAEEIEKRWKQEQALAKGLGNYASSVGAVPVQKVGESADEYHEQLKKAAMAMKQSNAQLDKVPIDEVIRQLADAAKENAASYERNAFVSADLEERTKAAAASIDPLPYHASAEEHRKFAQATADATHVMVLAGEIAAEQESAAREAIASQVMQRNSIDNVVAAQTERVAEEAKVQEALRHLKLPMMKAGDSLELWQETLKAILPDFARKFELTPGMMDEILKQKLETPKAPNFDFRGSRFDFHQNFAEGWDPGRVSVGFMNDLASIGERRMQSGFAPLFGVR